MQTLKTRSPFGEDAGGCTSKELDAEAKAELGMMEVVDQKDASQSAVMWNFGEGREGVFVQPTTDSQQVLALGQSGVPWWGVWSHPLQT